MSSRFSESATRTTAGFGLRLARQECPPTQENVILVDRCRSRVLSVAARVFMGPLTILSVALSGLLAPHVVSAAPLLTAAPKAVVINEIHYRPDPVTEWVEFVEIVNTGTEKVDLSGWLLDGAIDYLFPRNIVLMPGEYAVVAQHPSSFHAKYGWRPL